MRHARHTCDMFRRIVTLSAVAVCLAAAVLIAYNFTRERTQASRVGRFICVQTTDTVQY